MTVGTKLYKSHGKRARTDVILQKLDSPLATTIRGARLYQDAGADGLFVTGIGDAEIINHIVTATTLPVNVVGNSTLSSIKTLADCGVKRISMAGILYSAGYGKIDGMLTSIKAGNTLDPLFQ